MELQKKKEDLAGLLLDSQAGNAEHLEVGPFIHLKCALAVVITRTNR